MQIDRHVDNMLETGNSGHEVAGDGPFDKESERQMSLELEPVKPTPENLDYHRRLHDDLCKVLSEIPGDGNRLPSHVFRCEIAQASLASQEIEQFFMKSSIAARSPWARRTPKANPQSGSKLVSLLSDLLRVREPSSSQMACKSFDSSGKDNALRNKINDDNGEICALCRGNCRCGKPEVVGQPRPLKERRVIAFQGVPHPGPQNGMKNGFDRGRRIMATPLPGHGGHFVAMVAKSCANYRTRTFLKRTKSGYDKVHIEPGDDDEYTNQPDVDNVPSDLYDPIVAMASTMDMDDHCP